tara:strand:+ start:122 stop:304 length:183 start_codon:yes stop_codon:yes gene_type:complete
MTVVAGCKVWGVMSEFEANAFAVALFVLLPFAVCGIGVCALRCRGLNAGGKPLGMIRDYP